MGKKWLIIILILVILAAGIILFFPEKKVPIYSLNSSDWVWETVNGTYISVDKATEGHGYAGKQAIQLLYSDFSTAFKLDGGYNGVLFSTFDNPFSDNIKITNNMNPNDGIIEGYIVPKINDNVEFHIFVDQDWKQKIVPTNIFWGSKLENKKVFEFNEIEEGIYYDTINDSKDNYAKNYRVHMSSVIVGNIESIDKDNLSVKTFIRII